MTMTDNQKAQTERYLHEFVKLANRFSHEGNKELQEYWKGQVMGICKMIDLMELDISTKYFLNKML